MKKIKSVNLETVKSKGRRDYVIELARGDMFHYSLVKDEGEWVLQGEVGSRYSMAEVEVILGQLKKLNKSKRKALRTKSKRKTTKRKSKKKSR